MKGIILAAGYGTRLLPITKTVAKEMLPILHKPAIAFIIEEFIASGIKDIVIISSRRKKILEDYLDRDIELENLLRMENDLTKLELITPYPAHFSFIRQTEMKGTGHALMLARSFIGQEPAVVAYPDDLHFGPRPLSLQLIEKYQQTGCCVLASIFNPPRLQHYGVLALAADQLHVKDFVEKPQPGSEPSQHASIGRYLYLPDFFTYLEEGWKQHTDGEYFHSFALKKMMKQNKVVCHSIEGERFDVGNIEGLLQATLRYAKNFPELCATIKHEVSRW